MSVEKNKSVQIPLNLLYESPLNTYSTADVEDLTESIRLNGLMQPLYVEGPHEDGRYEVLGGARRLKALKCIAEDMQQDVPCIVTPIVDDDSMKKIIIETLNLTTREMSATDRYAHYFQLAAAIDSLNPTLRKSEKIEIFQRYVAKSGRYSGAFFHLNKSPRVRDLIGKKDLSVSIIDASYAVDLPEEQQSEWIRRVSGGEKASDVYNYITGKKLEMLSNPSLCNLVQNNIVTIADAERVAVNLIPSLQQEWCEGILTNHDNPSTLYESLKEKQCNSESKRIAESTDAGLDSPTVKVFRDESPKEKTDERERFSISLSEIENARKEYEPAISTSNAQTGMGSVENNFSIPFPPTYVAQAETSTGPRAAMNGSSFEQDDHEPLTTTKTDGEDEEFSPDQISEALAMLSLGSEDEKSSGSSNVDYDYDVTGATLFEEDSEAPFDASSFAIDSTGRASGLFKVEKRENKENDELTVEDARRMLTSMRRMSNQLHDFFELRSSYEEASVFSALLDNLNEIDI